MNKFKKGDLVWLPSNIMLTQMKNAPKQNIVSKWTKTNQPVNVVVLDGPIGVYYSILYEGEGWLARDRDLFLQEEG